jgi:hypothetical protein
VVGSKVPPRSDAVQVAALLDSPEITQLVAELEGTRWTGRPGYPIRTMLGMTLAKSLNTLPTWTRTVALVSEHAALRIALWLPGPYQRAERPCLLSLHGQAAGIQTAAGRLP